MIQFSNFVHTQKALSWLYHCRQYKIFYRHATIVVHQVVFTVLGDHPALESLARGGKQTLHAYTA
jgi:hypothetical protein